jgi:hypothetical protein
MILSAPKYIKESDIQDSIIRYKWDDWDVEQATSSIEEQLYTRLENISQRANVALAIGTAEWIIHRFEPILDDLAPLGYLTAAWAQMVDMNYAIAWEDLTGDEEWVGPVDGPIREAMTLVSVTLSEAEEDRNPARSAAVLCKLAEYLLTDPTPYLTWRERVLERFEKLYPLNPEEKLGEVVPREALNPELDFRLEQTESLVNAFLSWLDYEENDFLMSPQEMFEEGFEGTPYVFDIEEDRKNRFEW